MKVRNPRSFLLRVVCGCCFGAVLVFLVWTAFIIAGCGGA